MDLPFNREEADWVIVLEAMYDFQIATDQSEPEESDSLEKQKHKIKENQRDWSHRKLILPPATGLNEESLENALSYLRKLGLIHSEHIGLTQEGFQLIHQRKHARRQHYTNILLTILTVILVILTVVLVGLTLLLVI